MIACVCPSCGQKLRAPDEIAGKKVRCPRCSTTVSVGTATPTPSPQASEALTTALPAPPTSEVPTAELVAPLNSSEQQTITGPPRSANRDGALGLLAPPQSRDEIGRLGDYRVLSLLGQGGMGAVFEAEDTHLNRCVALKVILPEQADETARKRFLREARAAAAIEHDNIVPVFQVGEVEVAGVGRVPFLAMPLLRGETLEARLKREGRLPFAEVCHIGSQVAVGLAAAHERNLIHRDIKPGNVWLEEKPIDPTLDEVTRREQAQKPRSVVKILDFGLARGADDPREEAPQKLPEVAANKSIGATMLTQDGTIVGTPAYMSPEQVNGQADSRSDLFSLGCMLYQMSTGRLPFEGTTAMDTLIAVTSHNPRSPREVNRTTPEPLSKLIVRLLEKHPDDRPKSAMAVARKLSQMTQRHRAVSSLVLGLGSLVCLLGFMCYGLTCVVGVILGLIGWWRGGSDLRKMKAGLMDKAGHGMTMTGYVCSILGTCFNGLGVLVCGGFMLFVFGWTWKGSPPPSVSRPPTVSGSSGVVKPPPIEPPSNTPSPADALTRSSDLSDLPAEVIAVLGSRRLRLHGAPHFPAFSRDGKLLASASGNEVILFDAVTGRPGRTLVGHSGRVTALAFDREGKVLLTGSEDRTVRVWDVSNGRLLDSWQAGAAVRDLVFSPDGQLLATGTADGFVSLGAIGEPARVRVKAIEGTLHRLRFHPGGKLLATTGSDRHVRLLGVDGKQVWQAELAGGDSFALDFSPSGDRLAAGSDELLATWKMDLGEKFEVSAIGTVKAAAGGLVAFVEDGKAILTAPKKTAGSLERWTPDLQKQPSLKLSATADVLYATLSPDRRTLAWAAPTDRTLRLTDLSTGKPLLADELAHSSGITGVAFSPDGATLATADSSGRSIFWDVATGTARRAGPSHAGGVLGLAFSADGTTLASCGKDGLRLWSMAENKEVRHLVGEANGFRCLAFSPDGQHLVVAGDRGASLYDSQAVVLKKSLGAGPNDPFVACAISRDSKSVALVAQSGKLSAIPVSLGTEVNWPGAILGARDIAYVGDRFAVVGSSRFVRIRTTTAGLETLSGAAGPLHQLAARADGKLLAACGDDGAVRLWSLDSATSRPRYQRSILLAPKGGSQRAIGFSPCEHYLAVGDEGGSIHLVRLAPVGQVALVGAANAGLTELSSLTGGNRPPRLIALSAQAKATFGLAGCEDGSVESWSIPVNQASVTRTYTWSEGAITALALSRDGALAVNAGKDRVVRAHDAQSGNQRWQKEVPVDVSLLSISDDGKLVAAILGKEIVRWQSDTGKEVSRFEPAAEVTALALSADGGQVLLGTPTGALLLYDAAGKEVRRLTGHRGRVHRVTFSAGAMYSAGADGTVRRWDTEGKEVRQYRGHAGAVLDLCVTPNGKMLVTAGADRTVRLWLADTGAERDRTEFGGRGLPRQISCTGSHLVGLAEDGGRTTWQLPALASQ